MLIEEPLGNILGSGQTNESIDWLDLTWSECARRALSKRTRGGQPVKILLRLGAKLRHGDLIWRGERSIAVNVIPCDVLIVRPRDRRELAVLSYEFGNLHLPMQIDADDITTIDDSHAEALLQELGLPYEIQQRRFEPSMNPPTVAVAPRMP